MSGVTDSILIHSPAICDCSIICVVVVVSVVRDTRRRLPFFVAPAPAVRGFFCGRLPATTWTVAARRRVSGRAVARPT
uniref:Uncharacterized protein n=1 Tax=uncultured marine virus TaxID=186617 RepID=A0A0F7LAR6_9VIRU|nr:hypothetical protein [uncultured marine virus]